MKKRLSYIKEAIVGGGRFREAMLVKLLGRYYESKFRRDWILGSEEPHFYLQRMGVYDFAFGNHGRGPYPFNRGFFSAEMLRENDRLLDIGCGDGFFSRRFFNPRCAHIDA